MSYTFFPQGPQKAGILQGVRPISLPACRGRSVPPPQNFPLTDRNVSLSVVSRSRETSMRTMLQSTS